SRPPRTPHSFPTRRSSDLPTVYTGNRHFRLLTEASGFLSVLCAASVRLKPDTAYAPPPSTPASDKTADATVSVLLTTAPPQRTRSEERRVGKECRTRGWAR